MLNLQFLTGIMATEGRLKTAETVSIKTDFKVLQLLNAMRKSKRLFSVGYTSPLDQPEAIFSLSHVQNFLGPFQTPKQKGAHPPSGNPLIIILIGRRTVKIVTFINNISKTK
jgi:hypothetical protein